MCGCVILEFGIVGGLSGTLGGERFGMCCVCVVLQQCVFVLH